MAGIITGLYGFQRSGKTLLAYLIAESYRKKYNIEVYSNMIVPEWNTITRLSELPFNYEPKILLLDEAYFFLDSRSWNDNKDSTIFFNTIGKQNIMLMITAIRPDMVEKRLREQHNYMYFVKSDHLYIYYRIIDIQRQKIKDFRIKKNENLFRNLKYDTKQIPEFVDMDIKDFIKKVKSKTKNIENNKERKVI